jgi:hypothetical protein
VAPEPQIVGWREATASLSGATGLRPGRLRRRGSAEPLPPWSVERRCTGPSTQPAHKNGLQWYPSFNSRASSEGESFHNIDQAIPACCFSLTCSRPSVSRLCSWDLEAFDIQRSSGGGNSIHRLSVRANLARRPFANSLCRPSVTVDQSLGPEGLPTHEGVTICSCM